MYISLLVRNGYAFSLDFQSMLCSSLNIWDRCVPEDGGNYGVFRKLFSVWNLLASALKPDGDLDIGDITDTSRYYCKTLL